MTPLERIQDFLAQKRFAMIGVSREPKHFSRLLFREFQSRGYDTVPVNPQINEVDGQHCYARIADVSPGVDSVLLMTPPDVTATIVHELAGAGVKRVWMYRAIGDGAISRDAVTFCESQGIGVVPGECPFMFLPDGGWMHRFHGFVKKITGAYPR